MFLRRNVENYPRIIPVLPYFFGYKTGLFSFQSNYKNLDLHYKTDLDIWDCLGRENSYYSKIAKD